MLLQNRIQLLLFVPLLIERIVSKEIHRKRHCPLFGGVHTPRKVVISSLHILEACWDISITTELGIENAICKALWVVKVQVDLAVLA